MGYFWLRFGVDLIRNTIKEIVIVDYPYNTAYSMTKYKSRRVNVCK